MQQNYQKPISVSEDPLPFLPYTFQDRINKRILNSCQCFQLKYSTYNPQMILLASLNSLNYLLFVDKSGTNIEKIQQLPIQASFIIQTPFKVSNSIRCIFGDLKNRLQQIEINLNTQKIDVFNQPNVNEEFQRMIQTEVFFKWSLQHSLLILLTKSHLFLYHLKEHTYHKIELPSYARELNILPFTPYCNCILFVTNDSLITYNQPLQQWDTIEIGHKIVHISLSNQEIHVITDHYETYVYNRWLAIIGFKLELSKKNKISRFPQRLTVTYDINDNEFKIEEQDTQNPKNFKNQFISSDRQMCMKFSI